ncbi:hypothetical protein [Mycobacterium marinum]|uniref:hypothetical protein n=1 Tax=Mycobacterium marinum TaxID=1781 RepID=UPI0006843719|nr:hypothetical protein [Mycobacterium marinum]
MGAGRIELLVGPGAVLEGEGRGVGVGGDDVGEGGGDRHRRRGGGSGEGGVVAPGAQLGVLGVGEQIDAGHQLISIGGHRHQDLL